MCSIKLSRLWVLLSIILLLLLSAFAAKLSWQLAGFYQDKSPLPKLFRSVEAPAVPLFVGLQLFATSIEQAKSEALDRTTLRLKIVGLLLSEDPMRSQVVLNVENQQKVLRLGDKLPLSGEVVLLDIQSDKILLDNNGKIEYLGLQKMLQDVNLPAAQENKVQLRLKQTEFASQVSQFRLDLTRDPLSLIRYIKLVPKELSGANRGYLLQAGADQRLYRALELKPNDVLLSLNDIPMTDPSKLMLLPSTLSKNEPLKLGMLRDGIPLTFILYL
jgi:type II secretion system protein C